MSLSNLSHMQNFESVHRYVLHEIFIKIPLDANSIILAQITIAPLKKPSAFHSKISIEIFVQKLLR